MPRKSASHAPPPAASSSPLPPKALLDLYFLDARSKLIDIAAFLDRIERARRAFGGANDAKAWDDYRLAAFKEALSIVAGRKVEKAKAVQMAFSDPTTRPLESAAGMKGATGAWPGQRTKSQG